MIKVNNKKAITTLSRRSLKANKLRNIVAIIAIALTAMMFTSLFTAGSSIIESMEQSTMRQVGTSSHGGYKRITQAQYDRISTHPSIKDISYNIILGKAENEALKKVYTELRYSEDKSAKWGFNYPTTGTMPKDKMDIATTTAVLDALKVPHKLGSKVTLEFTVRGVKYKEAFTLCGFWESDPVAPANEAWLSKEYVLGAAPLYLEPLSKRSNGDISGTIDCSVWFANSWNIDAKVKKVLTDVGFAPNEINTGVNWAYSAAEVDFHMIVLILIVLLLILTSGYLIIFNIFYISVARDTRYYGLLKTIGTTGRQLKRIVRRQALILSCIGIPIGLICGYAIGILLVPYLMSMTNIAKSTVTSANPAIFIGAALFTLATVYISCNKPCRIAARVSPMEAVRYTEVSSVKKNRRKTKKVSIIGMAVKNVFRSRKKAVSVILSLSMSMILLSSVYAAVSSFDMDKFISASIISDFAVADTSLLKAYELTYMDAGFINDAAKVEGITNISPVYMSENKHKLSDAAYENVKKIIKEHSDTLRPPYSDDAVNMAMNEKSTYAHIYGIDKWMLSKLELFKGTADFEKFFSGDYVIVSTYYSDGRCPYYNIGDTVTLKMKDGTSKEYKVLALASMPSAANCLHGHYIDMEFIMADSEFLAHNPDSEPLRVLFNAKADKIDSVGTWLSNYCASKTLQYESKATYAEQFRGTQNMYMVVGGGLSFILAMIGILNFINSMVTSIHTRRRELAMLQSVGMTGAQMRKMLIGEGFTYAAVTSLFTLTVGTGIAYLLTHAIAAQIWFFTYHFTILPVIICIPILFAAAYFVPIVCYRDIRRESIVERLREAE